MPQHRRNVFFFSCSPSIDATQADHFWLLRHMGMKEITRQSRIVYRSSTLWGERGNGDPLHLGSNNIDTNPNRRFEERQAGFPDRLDRGLCQRGPRVEFRDKNPEEVEGGVMAVFDPFHDLEHVLQAIDTEIADVHG